MAPNASALASLKSFLSTTTTFLIPLPIRPAIAPKPIGPAPSTTILSSNFGLCASAP